MSEFTFPNIGELSLEVTVFDFAETVKWNQGRKTGYVHLSAT